MTKLTYTYLYFRQLFVGKMLVLLVQNYPHESTLYLPIFKLIINFTNEHVELLLLIISIYGINLSFPVKNRIIYFKDADITLPMLEGSSVELSFSAETKRLTNSSINVIVNNY